MPAVRIGDYWTEGGVVTEFPAMYVWDQTQEQVGPFPTIEEVSAALGHAVQYLEITETFEDCHNLTAAPRLPDRAKMDSEGSAYGLFATCENLVVPPKLPKQLEGDCALTSAFYECEKLIIAPVIPLTAKRTDYMFYKNTALLTPVSIPGDVERINNMFRYCENVTGELIIRPSSLTSYSLALGGTVNPLTIYGDKALCEAVAATASGGNATWSAWYDPVPAVTNRGQGSYTTAADMTRMVRNGALAVSTYAPGRMVYQQGDIVREDEWNALVEAAQTIDPTVTYSTHYANLNKIEAAFDSAL